MSLWKITDKGPSKVKETKFKQEKLFEEHLEDWNLWMRVSALGVGAARCADTVLLYRKHGPSRMNGERGR